MTIIDQRILIPASPQVVWDIISDIGQNPKWQADCQAISYLTSIRSGPGMRWRYTSPGGREYVVETTTWYDGLGYEYIYVDGAPFRESKGTLRLQEIPEGTVVQWTLNYTLSGVISGVRDSLTVRRSYNKDMVDSLKALWSYIKETGAARQSHEARSLMRDALDYEARAQYVPRHPSRFAEHEGEEEQAEEVASLEPEAVPVPVIVEPPVSDEDTKPHPAIAEEPAPVESAPALEPEPIEAAIIAEPQVDDVWDTPPDSGELARFRRPPQTESATEQSDAEAASGGDAVPEPAATEAQLEAPVAAPEVEASAVESSAAEQPESVTQEAQAEGETSSDEIMPEPPPRPTDTQPTTQHAGEEYGPVLDTSQLDTKEISIWQVFGMTPPSETDRMKAITEEQLSALDLESAPVDDDSDPSPVEMGYAALTPLSAETRPGAALIMIFGFRIRARRSLIRIRRRH